MNIKGVIFAVGIALQLIALFGDNATDIPPVLRIIAPKYFYASQCIKVLEADSSLSISNSADRGFAEIATILSKYTVKHANSEDFRGVKIQDVNVRGSAFIEGKMATSINWTFVLPKPILYKGVVADRGSDNWSFEVIKSDVDNLKQPNILMFSFFIFFIGTVIDVFAFRMESH